MGIARKASVVCLVAACAIARASAADEWIEVKSAHFTVVSNAGERTTRRLVWELEQVRSATTTLFSWAKADLTKPLAVIVAKDENSMRALAPEYWEQRGSIRPASVWMTGVDQHYMALRADVAVNSQGLVSPYISAYAAYVGLVMNQSLDPNLPLWFTHGFTRVLSNTIVRDDHILIGAPIPWHLEMLRERAPLVLPRLLTVTRRGPELTEADRRQQFDAETWWFVHFLMFGDEGKRASQLNAFIALVSKGRDAAAAFAETLGPIEPLESAVRFQLQGKLFPYQRFNLDVSVVRERFPLRPLPPAESASVRAQFHAAMRRPVEARAAIAEARKADPKAPGSYVTEGLLGDRDKRPDDAKAAYAKAVELGSTSAYAHYRLAGLLSQGNAPRERYTEIERLLAKAVELDTRFADAYAFLGDVQAYLGNPDGIGLINRAISLEPFEAEHRLRAARVLLRQGKPAEARAAAQAALKLAETDEERRDAERVLESAAKSGG